MSRDDFPKNVVDALGKRASFICSNPNCRKHTIAPSEASERKFVYIGKAAHICAAAKDGPRYDAMMSPEDRSAITNGVFLCSNCAELIDKNGGIDFPTEQLRGWKTQHEQWVSANLNKRLMGVGGDGGDGQIIGNRGAIIGGQGGNGGVAVLVAKAVVASFKGMTG